MAQQRKSFASLRPSPPREDAPDDDSIERVMRRIANTRDGQIMLGWLVEEGREPSHGIADGQALAIAEGERRLAWRITELARE